MTQLADILTGALAAGFVVLALWLAAPWGRRAWAWVTRPRRLGTVQIGMASRYGIMTRNECRVAFGGYQPKRGGENGPPPPLHLRPEPPPAPPRPPDLRRYSYDGDVATWRANYGKRGCQPTGDMAITSTTYNSSSLDKLNRARKARGLALKQLPLRADRGGAR